MKFYTNTGTLSTIQRCWELDVGLLLNTGWRSTAKWRYFAVDNGAYSAYARGVPWDPKPFLRNLKRIKDLNLTPDFAVLPDIVGGGTESLRHSMEWRDKLPREHAYYLAVQDGMIPEDVDDVQDIAGLFVGGTMPWKLSTGEQWVSYAHERGIRCHIGRIGPMKRIAWAMRIGADSIDSTTWVQRPKAMENISRAIRQSRLNL